MDCGVEFLLERLKELVDYDSKLPGKGTMEDLKLLIEDLETFKSILDQKASRKNMKDELFDLWDKRILEAVCDIEDTIDTWVAQANSNKANKTGRIKFTAGRSRKPTDLAGVVKNLRQDTIKPLMDEFAAFATLTIADAADTITAHAVRDIPQQRSQRMVGFEEEAKLFVDVLTSESEQMEICSIIGMVGLGKTALAWKVFETSTVKFEFPIRIWLSISNTLNMKEVLLRILSELGNRPDGELTDRELLELVKDHLDRGKFLIVMDDIGELDMWRKLKDILPTNNGLGKVLITTRNKDVGYNAATSRNLAHGLRFLSTEESWELLQYQAFGNNDVPPELVDVGRRIAVGCKGLPLSIVVIGGVLEEKTSKAIYSNTLPQDEWEEVCKRLTSYRAYEDSREQLLGSILSLSYNELPHHLRNCFLYLGVFPKDAEIPVKRLIRLWIAEGFVRETSGERLLEEIAHDYLEELTTRNLVMVRTAKPSGEAKMCQIHDFVREICKAEGEKLKLFHESEQRGNIETFRRLCIHSHARAFFSRRHKMMKVRSVLCFDESPVTLAVNEEADVTENFGLMRVYDTNNVKFQKFPIRFVKQLIHLRYVTLAVADRSFEVLPEVVADLWNLQTLIVDAPSGILRVKADIWKMRQLRHFETRAAIRLSASTISSVKMGRGEGGGKLQTLGRLSPESCTDGVCQTATGLLTLAIQGDLNNLPDSECFEHLESLKKLKLIHEDSSGGAAGYPWKCLPESRGFPPNLKILVLSGTHLEWRKMSIFSTINTLVELKLKKHAFQGSNWDAEGTGFVNLTCFHIDAANLREWRVSDAHFPTLKFLSINNCEELMNIPPTLGKSLEVLSLKRATPAAVECAGLIEQEQKRLNRVVRLDIAA